MKLYNSDGYPTITQVCKGKQKHKIDNDPKNRLAEPALFDRGGEVGNLKVMHSDGSTTTYYEFDGSFAITAVKIWQDGTTMDLDKIQLIK